MSTDQEDLPAEQASDPIPSHATHHPLQFSLFSMFLVTIVVAAACSLVFSMPAVVAVPLLVLFSVTLAAVLITVIVYGRSYQRTFCIGAMVPFGVFLLTLGFGGVIVLMDGPTSRFQVFWCRLALVGVWVSSILVGAICVGVRRLIERRPDSQ